MGYINGRSKSTFKLTNHLSTAAKWFFDQKNLAGGVFFADLISVDWRTLRRKIVKIFQNFRTKKNSKACFFHLEWFLVFSVTTRRSKSVESGRFGFRQRTHFVLAQAETGLPMISTKFRKPDNISSRAGTGLIFVNELWLTCFNGLRGFRFRAWVELALKKTLVLRLQVTMPST